MRFFVEGKGDMASGGFEKTERKTFLRSAIASSFRLLACITLLLSVVANSFSADFTAKTIGDYGNVTVMEVTGNYDANNPDGSINTDPRETIAKEFFRTHKDEYDFTVVFSNFDFQMPDADPKGILYGSKK